MEFIKSYTTRTSTDEQNLMADELMISNILRTLENPLLVKLMEEKELALLCKVVKEHTIDRANKISEIQDAKKNSISGRIK